MKAIVQDATHCMVNVSMLYALRNTSPIARLINILWQWQGKLYEVSCTVIMVMYMKRIGLDRE